MKDNKTIVTPLKSFIYLGVMIFAFSIWLCLSNLNIMNNDAINSADNFVSSNFTGGIFGIIIGVCFIFLGNKKRKIIFSDVNIEYITSKPVFVANYDEINLIKTFINPTNKSENLMIFVDETKIFSFSTSFFPREKLVETYNELLSRCNQFIEKEELTIDNELNW